MLVYQRVLSRFCQKMLGVSPDPPARQAPGAVKLLVPAGQSRAFPHGKVRDRSPYPDCHPRRRAEASGSQSWIEGIIYQSKKSHWGLGTLRDLGLSENSVPLNPMVNDHYPY